MNKRKSPELSVIVPAYNEEKNIKKVIEMIIYSLRGTNFEVIIVNDGSKDRTKEIAEALTRKYECVHLIENKQNMGYAATLKKGFKRAKGKYISFIDADLQNHPLDILKLFEWVDKKKYDVAIGWRKRRKDNLIRVIISKFWNILCHLLFQLSFPDINGKPKIFKAEILKDIEIETKQWVIDLELVHKAIKKGYRVIQIPVEHSNRLDRKSKADIKKGLISFLNLLDYRFKSCLKS